jgi:hypothetical protein
MLVKNVKKMTVLPSHRMHANSKNRIKKLIRKSSTLVRSGALRGKCALVISDFGEANRADTESFDANWLVP